MQTFTYTYYKRCTCSDGTRTDFAKGCPTHDPDMQPELHVGCESCADLTRQLAAVQRLDKEIAEAREELNYRELKTVSLKETTKQLREEIARLNAHAVKAAIEVK